nr:reverse transcriptase domain-containing protein [Tanacetum cinerariifolium]
MRIEQYFLMIDYSHWERLAEKNKLKARGTLLMALPDKHRLPTEWRTHTLIWRNKTDLEVQSLDDLFNSLKIYKAEVKSSSSASTSTQNIAFVSSQNTNNTNELVSAVASVSTASAKIPVSALPNVDTLINACDGVGSYDWSFQAEEEPTNYALMAFTSSSSSSSDNEVSLRRRYHAVPPPYTGTFIPPKPDLVFHDAPNVNETVHIAFNVELSPTKPDTDLSHTHRPSAPIIEDWVSDSEDDSEAELPQNAPNIPKPKRNGHNRNRKACFVCKSLTHLIKDCDYYEKKMAQTPARNHAQRGKHQHYARIPVTTVVPQPHVTRPRPAKTVVTKSHSPPRRNINHRLSPKPSNFPLKVTTVKVPQGNPQHAFKDKGVIDSGCSRHMTGNMSYLSDFEEINSVYVAFGGNPKGGKIIRKGKIRTGKLDFDDVYFVKELKFNLFSVSQMCNKKNSVLFRDTECIVLSLEFKLSDENQMLLRVPRENNMYNVDLKNIVPSGDLTCLFAKATLDESNLWHIRLGHINFKTMNKLVKDPLGKFDGKADEGFLVGYSVSSKAFRVFNSRTRIIQETLHINFLENKPNVAGSGPIWLFNINTLTKTMNYQPVTAGNQSNLSVGVQEQFDAEKAGEENVQQYVIFPLWSSGSKNPQNTDDDDDAFEVKEPEFEGKKPESEDYVSPSSSTKTKKHTHKTTKEAKGKSPIELSTGYRNLSVEFEDFSNNSINEVNAASTLVPAVGQILTNSTNTFSVVGPSNTAVSPTLAKSSYADFTNLETTITGSPIPTTKVHKDHPMTQIIGDFSFATQTRSMTRVAKDQCGLSQINNEDFHTCMFACFLSQEEPKREEGIDYEEVFPPVARIKAIRLFLAYASMGFMVYQMNVKSAFLYETIEEEVYVCQPPGFEDPDYPNKVYKVVKAPYGLHQAPRACQDKYVAEILRKFGLTNGKSASTPIDTEKHLLKDPDVKRIFRYLKGKPHLGLWYPKDSPFNLVAYSDSDYAGASLDRKSTTGSCQFIGFRLISWQCKKQTVVATSSTEAEYVAANNFLMLIDDGGIRKATETWLGRSPKDVPIEGHLSALRSLLKEHNERGNVSSIHLSFDDEEDRTRVQTVVTGKEIGDADLKRPFKEAVKTSLTRRIIEFVGPEFKMPANIKLYDGTTDPKDHLSRFSSAANSGEWPNPVWCRMFQQTLDGSARGWFENLSQGSIDGWAKLRQQFTTGFSTKRACFKHPTEITKIVRMANETLVAFKERWIVETSFIMGIPEVMKISSFIDAHKFLKLAKRYSDNVPKMVDEMMTRLDNFVRLKESFANTKLPKGEVTEGSKRPTGSVSRMEDRFHKGGYGADKRRNEGRNTFNPRDLRRQLEMALESGKLNHLIKDVRQRGQRNVKGRDVGKEKVINMIRRLGRPTHHRSSYGRILGSQGIREPGSVSGSDVRTLLQKLDPRYKVAFEGNLDGFVKLRGRRGKIDRLKIPPSGFFDNTLHGKVPYPKGVATLVTRSAIISECQRLERKQMIEQDVSQKANQEKEASKRVDLTQQILVNLTYPDQLVTIGGNLSKQCKNQELLKKSMDVFAWKPADMMTKKTTFYTDQGTYCYTKMPFRLKNAGATNQRLVDTAFQSQIGRNLEADVGKLAALKRLLSRTAEKSLPFFETLKDITKENKDEYRWTENAERAFQEMKKVIVELPLLTTPVKEETLYVYLAAATKAVSVVLLAERKGVQCLIHYVSRTLNEAERNYDPLEKLALSLLHMSRRLRRYFEAHLIKVITDQPLKQILNKAQASRKLTKYLVELGAYNIPYEPRSAMKGQVLADFLSEALPGTPTEEFFWLSAKWPNKDDMERWTIFTDGASNSKGSGAGLVFISPTSVEFTYALWLNFASINNEAEYEALLAGLRLERKIKVRNIDVKVDSKLVASQINESYVANNTSMIKYLDTTKECIAEFETFVIQNIPRNLNQKADILSKLATYAFDHLTKKVLVEVLAERSTDQKEVGAIVEEVGATDLITLDRDTVLFK